MANLHIINNRTTDNHLNKLVACFQDAEEIIIVSPFITGNFNFFPFSQFKHLKKITIITRLKPRTADQYDKVLYFSQLYQYAIVNGITVEILIDNSLHGKIYVAKKNDVYCEGLITSANFNLYGLKINNEWGVMINDVQELDTLVANLFDHIVLEPVTLSLLQEFQRKIDQQPLNPVKEKLNLI